MAAGRSGCISEFLAAFAENPAGPIYELMTRGDQLSVARSLGARHVSQFASQRPLWMKIKTAIRLLIDSGELSLNRPGASGWVTDQGLWLLSKKGADAIRGQLTKEGHSGIPTDNRRIFDIMAEGGLVDLNSSQKAVWRGRVQGVDWKPDTTFTLLRFPLDVIWDDPEAVPYFDGVVLESDESGQDSEDETPSNPALLKTVADSETDPEQNGPQSLSDPDGTSAETPLVNLFFRDVDKQAEVRPIETISGNGKGGQATGYGQRFLQWVEAGINKGIQDLNTAKAVVHILDQGVFVVSPLAFRKFAQEQNVDWNDVQKSFQALRINLKNHKEENWFKVRVDGKKISLLTGWIIPWEELSIDRKVEVNRRLTLVVQDVDQTG